MNNNINNKRTILLVEDEAIVAVTQKKALEKYGYNVITAKSGQEAINIFKEKNNIDLVLMDIDLGIGINGPETAKSILKMLNIPIVFLSSHTEPETVETTEKITSYGYVVKNSGITVLDASIKMAFKLFDANIELVKSEIKQKSLISNITDVIGITDAEGIVKYISINIEKLFGLQTGDVIGEKVWRWVHPDDLAYVMKEFLVLFEADNLTKTIEFRFKGADENFKMLEVTAANLLNDPVINGILYNFHDITGRRQAEDALKESESNYRQLFENSPAAIYRIDFKNGKILKANDVFCKYYGCSREEIASLNPYNILTEESKRIFQERLKKISSGEEVPEIVEYEVVNKNGNKWFLQLHNKNIYNADGHVIASDVVAHDITDSKRIETELRSKSALFEALVNSSIDGIIIVDNHGKKILQNNRCIELWKIPKHVADNNNDNEQVQHVMHFVEDPEKFVEKIEYLYKHPGEVSRDEVVLTDGTVLDRYSAPVLDKDGRHYGRIWLFRDITETRLAAEQLSRREEKYRSIFENIQDCYYEISIDGTILEISPSIEIVSNGAYHRNDLIGKSMNQFYPDEKERNEFLSVIHERLSVNDYEIYLQNKDGSFTPCAVSSKVCFNAVGNPSKIIGSIRNISDRKRAEERIQSLLNGKELMLQEVHHRIKNNMNTIYGLLSLQAETLKDPTVRKALEDAGSRVKSMMVLYDKLYTSADFQEISVSNYIPSLVDEIISNFQNNTSVRVTKKIEDFVLDVNKIQPLGIILNELLTNIMKYAFPGRNDGLISISITLTDSVITLIIEDNGVGMKDIKNYSGFGLMLVSLLTEQLNGKINFEHVNGTRIILTFNI